MKTTRGPAAEGKEHDAAEMGVVLGGSSGMRLGESYLLDGNQRVSPLSVAHRVVTAEMSTSAPSPPSYTTLFTGGGAELGFFGPYRWRAGHLFPFPLCSPSLQSERRSR